MPRLELVVVTPTEEVVRIDCESVSVPGSEGEVGLLPGHIPFITALKPGVLSWKNQAEHKIYAVSTGYAEVNHDRVTVATTACIPVDSIQPREAEKNLQDSQQALQHIDPQHADYVRLRRDADLAQAKLDAHAQNRSP